MNLKLTLSLFCFFILFRPINSFSFEGRKRILVSVGDLKENQNPIWKKKTCDQIFSLANKVVPNGVDIICRSFNTDSFQDESLKKMSSGKDFHLRVLRTKDDKITADITKLNRIHDTDFTTLGWTFKDGQTTKITKEEGMAKALGNFFFYVENETAYKAALLASAAQESKEIKFDKKKGWFVDKITNTPISTNAAYSRFEKESERKKNFLRTGVEIGVLLSSGMAVYYKNLVSNKVDFDYTLVSGLKSKLNGSAILFDNNDKFNNYGHEFAGVIYNQMARANGFTSLESFLIGFATSTAWEFLEYHEVLSINDEILTPVGGFVLGEASYQIACALLGKKSIAASTMAYIINPGLGVNHGIDKLKNKNKFSSQPDCKKKRWSDISVYLGLDAGQKAYNSKTGYNYLVGLNATVMNIENYGNIGQKSKILYDTSMAKALIEINGNDGSKDLRVIAQIVHAAFYQKNINRDAQGELRGYDFLLGLGSASTWSDRGAMEGTTNEDFYGTVNILGATAHLDLYFKGFNLKADFGFYGDFTMVKSYSLDKYKNGHPGGIAGMDSTLLKRGYYWGFGPTAMGYIAIQNGKWEVGYNGQSSSASSIEGRHRYEESITNHAGLSDSLFSNKIYISYEIIKNLKIRLSSEYNLRKGEIDNAYKNEGAEKRIIGTLEYHF